ncbi:hypothetical protein [Bradyrhizobium sp. CCBAU 51627]|uniref:hypothetical protein n=1 Tax=Bradyrhizobium sp. CCBAU 51627 TaxID=1325088 RepID=UPI00230684DB|nr:hypothetical protein [Bradyrhizobium sp. CCBAU 51627]MDA9431303.1 hypothetical protein [Bradyrhizobium sp. CCBAU 51627]
MQGVNTMEFAAIDLGVRGATSGVFLMIILVAWLRRASNQQALLGMAMSAGGIFYAIATAPFSITCWCASPSSAWC